MQSALWIAILYSDLVFSALLSILFLIITSILFFSSAAEHQLDVFRELSIKLSGGLSWVAEMTTEIITANVKLGLFFPHAYHFTCTEIHLPFYWQVSQRPSDIPDNWPLPLLFCITSYHQKTLSSRFKLFSRPPMNMGNRFTMGIQLRPL